MYDKDSSGTIELREMIDLIATLYDMEGHPNKVLYTKEMSLVLIVIFSQTTLTDFNCVININSSDLQLKGLKRYFVD